MNHHRVVVATAVVVAAFLTHQSAATYTTFSPTTTPGCIAPPQSNRDLSCITHSTFFKEIDTIQDGGCYSLVPHETGYFFTQQASGRVRFPRCDDPGTCECTKIRKCDDNCHQPWRCSSVGRGKNCFRVVPCTATPLTEEIQVNFVGPVSFANLTAIEVTTFLTTALNTFKTTCSKPCKVSDVRIIDGNSVIVTVVDNTAVQEIESCVDKIHPNIIIDTKTFTTISTGRETTTITTVRTTTLRTTTATTTTTTTTPFRPPGRLLNPSFDNDTVGEECFGDTPSFWSTSLGGCVSTFNPYPTTLSAGACHGPNFAEISQGSLSQRIPLGFALRRGDNITVTFNKIDAMDMYGDCRVSLQNGNLVEFASTGVIPASIPSNSCRQQTLTHRVRSTDRAHGFSAVVLVIEKVGGAVCDVDNFDFFVSRSTSSS